MKIHRLSMFENRVLRRIFGPRRDEVAGEWKKQCKERLRDLYSSPSVIRITRVEEDEMEWACSTNDGGEELVQAIGGKARGKETTRKTKTELGG
jgi:hypothetical protein